MLSMRKFSYFSEYGVCIIRPRRETVRAYWVLANGQAIIADRLVGQICDALEYLGAPDLEQRGSLSRIDSSRHLRNDAKLGRLQCEHIELDARNLLDEFTGYLPNGIERTIASTPCTASSFETAVAPISRARSRMVSGPFELASLTSWPLAASFRANVAPMFPAPMISIFMGCPFVNVEERPPQSRMRPPGDARPPRAAPKVSSPEMRSQLLPHRAKQDVVDIDVRPAARSAFAGSCRMRIGDETAQETDLARHFSRRIAPPRSGSGRCFQNRPGYDFGRIACFIAFRRTPFMPARAES